MRKKKKEKKNRGKKLGATYYLLSHMYVKATPLSLALATRTLYFLFKEFQLNVHS